MPDTAPPPRPDVGAAARFLAGNGRLLDRARFDLRAGRGDADRTLAALAAYRNPDGGYGHGLEPDLRASDSQPAAALHAFEVLAELAPTTHPHAVGLCDWLAGVALEGGALPFALPVADPTACAPFWVDADPAEPSLQITAVVAATTRRVARHDAAVAAHTWVTAATRWCVTRLRERAGGDLHALERLFALWLLDTLPDGDAEADELVQQLVAPFVADGRVPVAGGSEDEAIGLLDAAPRPGRVRAALPAGAVADALEELAGAQQADGGWAVDFASSSPMAALEWRGYATVRAVATLSAG